MFLPAPDPNEQRAAERQPSAVFVPDGSYSAGAATKAPKMPSSRLLSAFSLSRTFS